jgi:hypothetical protein
MNITVMEAKTLLISAGGVVILSSEQAAVLDGLDDRQTTELQPGALMAWNTTKRICVPTRHGLEVARERLRRRIKEQRQAAGRRWEKGT